jgi:hypothetical protein
MNLTQIFKRLQGLLNYFYMHLFSLSVPCTSRSWPPSGCGSAVLLPLHMQPHHFPYSSRPRFRRSLSPPLIVRSQFRHSFFVSPTLFHAPLSPWLHRWKPHDEGNLFFPPTLLALFNCPRSCAPYTLPPCAARLETLLWPPPARGFFWPMSKGRGIRP